MASIFGRGSIPLVEDELLVGALLDLAWVHLPLLVEHQDFLLLVRVEVDIVFESIDEARLAAEEDHS